MNSQLNIFAIYSQEDKALISHLLKELKPLQEKYKLAIWHNDPIYSEQVWKPQDESILADTDLFLLLVSDTFMHSRFIQQLEFKMVIDQYKSGQSTVIPVIIDKCPWDIDFRSDDYNFNLNELGVLPEEGKPIKDWASQEDAFENIVSNLERVIPELLGGPIPEESEESTATKLDEQKKENQTAIDFDKEQKANEERKQSIEVARVAETRIRKEEDAKIKAEEARKVQAETESKRRAELEREKKEVEAKRKVAEERRLQEEILAKRQAKEEHEKAVVSESDETKKEDIQESKTDSKKKLIIGVLIGVLAFIGIWKTTEVEDSVVSDQSEGVITKEIEPVKALAIGDFHEGGMVFVIDADSQRGKVVHMEDAGPMIWYDAMEIHEQLGQGWRLPTFDELLILYKTVGQGNTNDAEFSNGLYWSATDYDEHQAKLLRFRDGNRSYHYNKLAEHRKFRVRAIRDFSSE